MKKHEAKRFLEDASDTYYVTDYYRPYLVVLVRLSHVDRDALCDLLSVSWRMTMEGGKGHATPRSLEPDIADVQARGINEIRGHRLGPDRAPHWRHC